MAEINRQTQVYCGLAILASAAGAVAVAETLKLCARHYRELFDDMLGGKPLPVLTEFVFSMAKLFQPVLGGILLGILILVAGGCLLFSAPENRNAYQRTVAYTIAVWVSIALFVGVVWLAFRLPMMTIISSMQKEG